MYIEFTLGPATRSPDQVAGIVVALLLAALFVYYIYDAYFGRSAYSHPQRNYTPQELSQETAWARAETERVEEEIKLRVKVAELQECRNFLAKRK